MPPNVNKDVNAIREWMVKESHLPKDMDDFVLSKFLHSCYGSLERTKKCINRFCTARRQLSEIYSDRDPSSDIIRKSFSIASVATYETGDSEILIHQLDDPTLKNFDFYGILKSFCMVADIWIKMHPYLPEGHIIILDMKSYSWKMVPKEGMPVRVKKIYGINAPSYYEKLYALVKPALPAEICDIITFYPDSQSLHKDIDKQYLPEEYGGDAPSMIKQNRGWVEKILTERKMYLNDNMWKADLKMKTKTNAMSGSFRTLSID